jgi:ABC-type uncharacterized transport system auxiliary subunit
MNLHKKVSILLLGFALFLGACLNLKQPPNKIDYYALEYDPPKPVDSKPLDIVVRLERFGVAATYDTNRMIYRDSSFKRNAYVYHKWWSNPGEFATQFLARDIRRSGLFAAVVQSDSRLGASYTLEGSVDEFLELDTEETWRAVLSLTVVLVSGNDETGKRIVFQKTYNADEECKQKNPRALAEAMSGAMARTSAEIIKDVYRHLLPKHQ